MRIGIKVHLTHVVDFRNIILILIIKLSIIYNDLSYFRKMKLNNMLKTNPY